MNRKVDFTGEELLEQALNDWRTYSKKYRELIPTYHEMYAQRRVIKKTVPGFSGLKLNHITKEVLNDLVEIPFFEIENEEEAREYLNELTLSELKWLLVVIKMAIESRSYKTITVRLCEYRHFLSTYKSPKSQLGFDPNYCKQGTSLNGGINKSKHIKNGED